jgi:hypothetical protein
MLLFAVFASFGFAGSELTYRMADEIEYDLPVPKLLLIFSFVWPISTP